VVFPTLGFRRRQAFNMGLTLEPMPGRRHDRAAQSLVLAAQPAAAINVQSDYTRWRGRSVRGGRPKQEAARSAASFIFKQADHVAYWQILF